MVTFDYMIIAIETGKMLLYMFSQFLLLDVSILLMVWLFQSTVRMLVCLYFINLGLMIVEKDHLIKPMQIGYCATIIILLAFVVISSITDEIGADCKENQWHWYVLSTIDTL